MNPAAIAGALFPLLASGLGITLGYVAATVIGYGVVAAALIGGALLLNSATAKPTSQEPVPKPEDGKFNLKQSVPPLSYVLGIVKKGGDYAFLEETGGVAYHIIVDAAHSIKSYAGHYLHDEWVTLSAGGVVEAPTHFGQHVLIKARAGADVSTAYDEVVTAFPAIWTADHRGDGLASVLMVVESVASEDFQSTYPQAMPSRVSLIEGHNRLYDPRTDLYGYSQNIAIFRLWHLTHPVGGKMTLDDMYLPDWSHAADICDEVVGIRSGGATYRYHGGFWFRSTSSPVDVGRILDQAGDLVLYERQDGKIGVHAGEYVEPTVRLTTDDLLAVRYDANERRSSRVLAVRGRYTEPAVGFITADAAIYGDPYEDDTERTRTVENQAVQDHNHISRLMKLAYLRANAPRVHVVAHFDAARDVPYSRFVRIHHPPKLDEAVIELTGRPTLSLQNLTYEFEGIVVTPDLYAFNAGVEEGAPGATGAVVERGDVPEPEGFDVTIQVETVSGGSASLGVATFTLQNPLFQYELAWQPTAGGVEQSATGISGALEVRSAYLADAVEYRFRARTWSFGAASDWTSYIVLTT